jgi:acetamidase/formamidase
VLRDLHSGVALEAPLVETAESWIVIGFADTLDEALTGCLRELISWLAAATELTKSEAYALASMAVSFRVTQTATRARTAAARPSAGASRRCGGPSRRAPFT